MNLPGLRLMKQENRKEASPTKLYIIISPYFFTFLQRNISSAPQRHLRHDELLGETSRNCTLLAKYQFHFNLISSQIK